MSQQHVVEVPGPPDARGNQSKLIIAQLLSGVSVASGVAVGGVLAQTISGQEALAGLGQTCTVVGAGLAAIPLAKVAAVRHLLHR